MKKVSQNEPCACGSGSKWKRCCGPVIDGVPAATPEALMRSRYAAFATGSVGHLVRSIHPDNPSVAGRPAAEVLRELADYCAAVTFTRLEVLATTPAGADGYATVHFRAHSTQGVQEEVSRFCKLGGRWVYVDGVSA